MFGGQVLVKIPVLDGSLVRLPRLVGLVRGGWLLGVLGGFTAVCDRLKSIFLEFGRRGLARAKGQRPRTDVNCIRWEEVHHAWRSTSVERWMDFEKFEAQSRELSIAVLGGNATSSCEGIFLRPRMHLFGHREFYWPMCKADMWEF